MFMCSVRTINSNKFAWIIVEQIINHTLSHTTETTKKPHTHTAQKPHDWHDDTAHKDTLDTLAHAFLFFLYFLQYFQLPFCPDSAGGDFITCPLWLCCVVMKFSRVMPGTSLFARFVPIRTTMMMMVAADFSSLSRVFFFSLSANPELRRSRYVVECVCVCDFFVHWFLCSPATQTCWMDRFRSDWFTYLNESTNDVA